MSTPVIPTAYRVTPARVMRSEWHKLWSLRSTWITLISAYMLILGIGILMGTTYDGDDSDVDTITLVLLGTQLAQIFLAVLGILVTAGEYSTGMIRASLMAVPRRLPVLWSKAAVFGALVFGLSLVTVFATFLIAQIFLAGTEQARSLGDPGIARALFGSAAALTLLGLLALGLGALVRSVPGAIGAYIGGVLILPEVLAMLPYDAVSTAMRYFPTKAVEALTTSQQLPGTASPGAALLALILWAAAAVGAAGLLLKRRDV
ncbi:ABC transporter permease [Streptomyces sp. NBC_01142]|uniref:ABC transporter permease n=1 Tax=Streptomyces sp. NBC_01142 TaxID=2975865 RepID=UPI0022511AFA|nr:ABC transporter permease [Streptomyces sp. NBC_01142]MCX4824110.1 ABC transporter permease [Streptomyces sp. NBC_01142]